MTPSAKSDAISAQQQPMHQRAVPAPHPQRAAPARRATSRGGSRAGCGTCPGRRPSAASARRRRRRGASRRRPSGRRGPRRARRPRPRLRRPLRATKASTPDARPRQQIAGGEEERATADRRSVILRVERDRRGDRREHHRGHHHDPDGEEPAERAEAASTARRPSPAICARRSTTSHTPAMAKSSATSPSRARAAAKAGAEAAAGSRVFVGGGDQALRRPRRTRTVERPVLPSYSIPKALIRDRFASAMVSVEPTGMEHARRTDGLAGLDPERDDVLDLEVDHVADADAVTEPVVDDLDRDPLDTEHLADERSEACHRASELAAEDGRELLGLLVRGFVVDEHAELPVAVGHDLRACPTIAATLRPLTSVPSISPSRMLKTSVDPAVVVRRAMVEREVARAHQLARAGLDVAALQAPGHRVSLRDRSDGDCRPALMASQRLRRRPPQGARPEPILPA